MRTAFTLIELMIVIAIIAVIAAIAIPNLLESRVTAQESAAAQTLKGGIVPAEVQFQNGGYSDGDGDGIGAFCVVGASGIAMSTAQPYDTLSGQATISGITLNLLAPTFTGVAPSVSSFRFVSPEAETRPAGNADYESERVWATLCYPADNNQGRRFFSINQAGNVYVSKASPNAAAGGGADISGSQTPLTSTLLFGASLVSAPSTAYYLPFRK